MIYTDQQLVKKIRKMIVDFEDEVVEFKEARTNYSFKDIGKYFSSLKEKIDNIEICGCNIDSETHTKNEDDFYQAISIINILYKY